MNYSADVLFKGRNQNLLLSRLKRAGVKLQKVKVLSENEIILTIKRKDMPKVFEISQNMWYNTIVRYHGAKRALDFIKSKAVILIATICFLLSVWYLDGAILSVDLCDVPNEYRTRVQRIVEGFGVKPFSRVENVDFDAISLAVDKLSGVKFSKVTKTGYALKISLTTAPEVGSPLIESEQIVSSVDGVIKRMTVFSGRAIKNVGDPVKVGDVICEGFTTLSDMTEIKTACVALVVIETQLSEDFSVLDLSEKTIADCIAKTTLSLFGEQTNTEYIVNQTADGYIVTVTAKFLVTYGV
ncbi:MAG: sporulation protein YqfD [Clostridia bacterium]|nr:sporulation protein YqfD [Clostridia bacterium]